MKVFTIFEDIIIEKIEKYIWRIICFNFFFYLMFFYYCIIYLENLIINEKNYDYMYLIDFGLSSKTTSNQSGIEDKAVDLYVLKRAMISNNPKSEEVFEKIINIYAKNCVNGEKIIEHYKKVEMRGRKRIAFG